MNNKKLVLHIGTDNNNHAGPKAMRDCETILIKKGFSPLYIKQDSSKSIINKIKLLKILIIPHKAIVVIHHPYYNGTLYMKLLCILKKIKKVNLIFLIHDIESLRVMFKKNKDLFIDLDNQMFDLADYIIAHNTTMKDYLINERNVDKQKIYILELFDYLVKHDNTCKEYQENNRLTIAGNLDQNKSGYIYSIIKQSNRLSFNLYGVNYMNIFTSDKCQYYGSFSPDILPNILTGAFGIVWDGPQLNTCAGTVGNYVRYNNPHKVSLYIAASLPIIIWRHAALAQFVEKENIGILIDDLNQLEKLVSTISEEQYRNMKQNITKLSYKVKNGFYLNKVMDEILLNFNQKK